MELMKRILALPTLILISATAAFAQADYTKWEFFGGYSALQFDNIGGDTGNPNVDDILSGRNMHSGFNHSEFSWRDASGS